MTPTPTKLRSLYRAFLRELPRLLADGQKGRHALIKGEELLSIWDTFADGYQAGRERFGIGVAFLIQPIDPKFLDYPWGEDLVPRRGSEGQPHHANSHDSAAG